MNKEKFNPRRMLLYATNNHRKGYCKKCLDMLNLSLHLIGKDGSQCGECLCVVRSMEARYDV